MEKQKRLAFGVVSKGNGEAFLSGEKHMSLSVGGGQAGQGFPCVLIIHGYGNRYVQLQLNRNDHGNINGTTSRCD